MEIIDWHGTQLTDEMIVEFKKRIGQKRRAKPWNSLVTEDSIWHMANAVGDDNPLWWDPAYAQKTRWKGLVAPPYYLYSCWSGTEKEIKDRMGLPGILGLWYGDRWEWYQPIRCGDTISGSTFLAEVNERTSKFAGRALQQVDQTDFVNQRGEAVAKYQQIRQRFSRSGARSKQKYLDITQAAYSIEQLKLIEDAYAAEAARRRGPIPRYWEDVSVGTDLNPLVKGPLTVNSIITWLMGWGSPLCMTNRILFDYLKEHPQDLLMNPSTNIPDTLEAAHWDSYFAQQSGLPLGYDFGAMRCSWFIHQMADWMGDDAFLRCIEAKYIRPNLLGDTCWLTGMIKDKFQDKGKGLIRCEMQAANQRGDIVAGAFAIAELPIKGNSSH